MTKFCFDLDGTLCSLTTKGEYRKSIPKVDRIRRVNALYDMGHTIMLYTARGTTLRNDMIGELTKSQLKIWGVKYHKLIFGKPEADQFIDDKGTNAEEFFKK